MNQEILTQKGENLTKKAAVVSMAKGQEAAGQVVPSRVFSARLKAREKFKSLHEEKQLSAEA